MNNLQYVVKDNTRYAMHVAVELCEQGDFDSPYEAVHWLMQERDDSEPWSGRQASEAIAKLRQTVRDVFSKTHISMLEEGYAIMRAIDEVEAAGLGSGTCNPEETATLENVTAHVMECDECGGTYEHVNGDYERCPRCGRKATR